MDRVKVLQGKSICEGGIWYNQGAVLEVADAAEHDGSVEHSTEEINTPAGLVPAQSEKE